MKNLAASLLLIVGFSSCTTYQYTALKSDLPQAENTKNYFYQDSLIRMDFDFWGQDFPTKIVIENLSGSDLYLDLARTLFLKNNEIISNAVPSEKGRISGRIVYDYNGLYSTGDINAITETQAATDLVYIPFGKKIQLSYSVFSFPFNKNIRYKSQNVLASANGSGMGMHQYIYPNETAPNYGIRFYFLPKNTRASGHIIECSFSPNMVITGGTIPDNFIYKGSDLFYTKQTNSGGSVLVTLLVLTLLFGSIAAIGS